MSNDRTRDRAIYLGTNSAELFASYTDKYLQDYLKAVTDGDDEGLVYASVAMWQLAKSMGDFFKDITLIGLHTMSPTHKARAQEVATKLANGLSERMHNIAANGPAKVLDEAPEDMIGEVVAPKLPPTPNRGLN